MGCAPSVVWFCSIESKKSIKSASGPLAGAAGLLDAAELPLTLGKALLGSALLVDSDLNAGIELEVLPPLCFFASISARYCLLCISKSGSPR